MQIPPPLQNIQQLNFLFSYRISNTPGSTYHVKTTFHTQVTHFTFLRVFLSLSLFFLFFPLLLNPLLPADSNKRHGDRQLFKTHRREDQSIRTTKPHKSHGSLVFIPPPTTSGVSSSRGTQTLNLNPQEKESKI